MDKLRLRTIVQKLMNVDDALDETEYMELEQFESDLTREIIHEWTESVNVEYAANHILLSAGLSGSIRTHGSWISDCKQYLLDSFRIMEINNPIDLPKLSDDVDPLKVKPMLHDIEKADITVPLPSISELKQLILENLNSHTGIINRIIYRFECGLVLNAEYLLAAITATGVNELKTSYTDGKFRNPVFFKSEFATVMVLPMIPDKKYEKCIEIW